MDIDRASLFFINEISMFLVNDYFFGVFCWMKEYVDVFMEILFHLLDLDIARVFSGWMKS